MIVADPKSSIKINNVQFACAPSSRQRFAASIGVPNSFS
jgi:hypothetical protein